MFISLSLPGVRYVSEVRAPPCGDAPSRSLLPSPVFPQPRLRGPTGLHHAPVNTPHPHVASSHKIISMHTVPTPFV